MDGSQFNDSISNPGVLRAQSIMSSIVNRQQFDNTSNRASADRQLCERTWKDPRFFPINIDTVMIYFCQRENPFFDNSSDNAMLLMQNRDISAPLLEEKLKKCTGIQYVLVQPPSSLPLFVIRKQQRTSVNEITPLCHYYILDGTVYQAPDLYTFIHSRLISIMDPLKNAFSEAIEMLRFKPYKGYYWEFKTKGSSKSDENNVDDAKSSDLKKEKETNAQNVRATPYQRFRTNMLLQELANRFDNDERMDVGTSRNNEFLQRIETIPSTKEQEQPTTSNTDINLTVPGSIDFEHIFGSFKANAERS